MLGLVVLLIGLKSPWLSPVQASFHNLLLPFHWVWQAPKLLWDDSENYLMTREQLIKDNERLQNQSQVLQRKLQKMAAVLAENTRLRELLNASAQVDEDVFTAEIIGVSPSPYRQEVLINQGRDNGVYEGQAVLDANGLAGQVVEAFQTTSRVLLITDLHHSTPVQSMRTGIRAIAEGVGRLDLLQLANVPETADIRVGDLLVTSGLGKRFPPRYPVAKITVVKHEPGQAFMHIEAKPLAQLNQSAFLMLVK